jgi:hypothetical protein
MSILTQSELECLRLSSPSADGPTLSALRALATTGPAELASYASASAWKPARHLCVLANVLQEASERGGARIIVMMPPRHGKSELTDRYFPAWHLGRNPSHRIILASYEASFAADWGRAARDLMREFGPERFGVSVRPDQAAADSWALPLPATAAPA